MSYGPKIKEIRRRELLSQEAFAERIGVSRSVVSQIEIDRINPTLETLKKIAEEFNVSIDFLMMEEEKPQMIFNVMDSLDKNLKQKESYEQFSKSHNNFSAESEMAYYSKIDRSPRKGQSFPSRTRLQEIPVILSSELAVFKRTGFLTARRQVEDRVVLPIDADGQWLAIEMDDLNSKNGPGLLVCQPARSIHCKRGDNLLLLTADNKLLQGHLDFMDHDRIIIEGVAVLLGSVREWWKVEWEMRRSR